MKYKKTDLDKVFSLRNEHSMNSINKFPISAKWRNFLVETFKRQASLVEEPEDIEEVIEAWYWMKSPVKKHIIHMINLLWSKKVSSISGFIEHHLSKEDFDYKTISDVELKRLEHRLRKQFTMALKILYDCDLIEIFYLDKATVGRGKRTVTLYVSPFAKAKDIEKEKFWYLFRGGEWGNDRKKPMSEEEYDQLMRRRMEYTKKRHAENKNPKKSITYKCTNCNQIINVSSSNVELKMKYEKGTKCKSCKKGKYTLMEV